LSFGERGPHTPTKGGGGLKKKIPRFPLFRRNFFGGEIVKKNGFFTKQKKGKKGPHPTLLFFVFSTVYNGGGK